LQFTDLEELSCALCDNALERGVPSFAVAAPASGGGSSASASGGVRSGGDDDDGEGDMVAERICKDCAKINTPWFTSVGLCPTPGVDGHLGVEGGKPSLKKNCYACAKEGGVATALARWCLTPGVDGHIGDEDGKPSLAKNCYACAKVGGDSTALARFCPLPGVDGHRGKDGKPSFVSDCPGCAALSGSPMCPTPGAWVQHGSVFRHHGGLPDVPLSQIKCVSCGVLPALCSVLLHERTKKCNVCAPVNAAGKPELIARRLRQPSCSDRTAHNPKFKHNCKLCTLGPKTHFVDFIVPDGVTGTCSI
jgi:hypothetical protein